MPQEILSAALSWIINYKSTHINMTATNYWPMGRKYSVWNVAVAALQFWTADLEACVLSSASEEIYGAFFYLTFTYILHQQSDEILFSHFVTTLNATLKHKLALEDEGYDRGLENFNISTPLWRTSRIHHVSSIDNASFDPTPGTPCTSKESHLRPVGRQLTYSSPDDDNDITAQEILFPTSTEQHHINALQQSLSKSTLNTYAP